MSSNTLQKDGYLEDRLLRYANLFEGTARAIKNGHVYSNAQLTRMKKFLDLIDKHQFLDTTELQL